MRPTENSAAAAFAAALSSDVLLYSLPRLAGLLLQRLADLTLLAADLHPRLT